MDPEPGEPEDERDIPREPPHRSRSVSPQPPMEPIVLTPVLAIFEV